MFTTATINSNPKVHYCYADETGITGTVCKTRGSFRIFWQTAEPATCARCVKIAG
jgi:hypothetical protein